MPERFNQRIQIRQQNLSSGAAGGLMALGDQFQRFNKQALQWVEEKVTKEGVQQGRSAFEKGEKPAFMKEGFIGGVHAAAFNKGLAHSYKASLANDIRTDLAMFARESPDDVEGFDTKVAGLRSSLGEIDPLVREDVENRFEDAVVGYRLRVQDQQAKEIRQEQVEASNAYLETAANDAMVHARAGDVRQSANAIIEAHELIDERLESELIDVTQAAEEKREIELLATQERFKGNIEREADSKGLEHAFKTLEKLSTKPPKGLTQPEWDLLRSDMQQTLTRKRSIANVNRQAKSTEAVDALKDYSKSVSLGMTVSPQETARVQELTGAVPELKKQFDIINDVKSFSLMPAAERQNMLTAAKAGDLDDVDKYAAMIKAESQIQKALKDDAYGFSVKQGLIENIPFSAENYPKKTEQAKRMSLHHGVDVSPLSKNEISMLVDGLPEATTEERISLALTFKGTPMVWEQLAEKQAGVFAQAGATGDADMMKVVFTGQDALLSKTATSIKAMDYLADFHEFVGQAYMPREAGDVLETAKAYYAGTNNDGIYTQSKFNQALEAVTGGIVEINGVKVEQPRGVDPDDFENFVEDMQAETVRALGGVVGRTDEEAAELISNSVLRGHKDGYLVDTGLGLLYSGPGIPFILKYSDDEAAKNVALVEVKEKANLDARRERRATRAERSRAENPTPFSDFVDLLRGNVPERGK